ncbi:MAG: electron transport complex subunit RsxG [Methylophilaceae bacterium]|nr:electron transport complex subunit RsxG [Methylophilaceae bacterium]
MASTLLKHALKTAATLIAFALIWTLLLALVHKSTEAPIAVSEAEARLSLFRQILPDTMHDNDLLKNILKVPPNPQLGNKEPIDINIAKINNKTVAIILEVIAPDGYSGNIELLIAIRADGTLSGVRVLAHKETPGLGDYIDVVRGNWIKHFDNESLIKTPPTLWKVKKDSGKFDYMAGATITPRAVVKAVFKALTYAKENQAMLFADASASH